MLSICTGDIKYTLVLHRKCLQIRKFRGHPLTPNVPNHAREDRRSSPQDRLVIRIAIYGQQSKFGKYRINYHLLLLALENHLGMDLDEPCLNL